MRLELEDYFAQLEKRGLAERVQVPCPNCGHHEAWQITAKGQAVAEMCVHLSLMSDYYDRMDMFRREELDARFK